VKAKTWFLQRGEGWVMPAGTSWGTESLRRFAEKEGLAEALAPATCDLYLRSIGAVPFDEYVTRAESAEGVVGLLVEALRYARDYVPVSARAQTMEPTTLPSTYYIYGRKPLHPVITAALAAAAALELETETKGGEEDG